MLPSSLAQLHWWASQSGTGDKDFPAFISSGWEKEKEFPSGCSRSAANTRVEKRQTGLWPLARYQRWLSAGPRKKLAPSPRATTRKSQGKVRVKRGRRGAQMEGRSKDRNNSHQISEYKVCGSLFCRLLALSPAACTSTPPSLALQGDFCPSATHCFDIWTIRATNKDLWGAAPDSSTPCSAPHSKYPLLHFITEVLAASSAFFLLFFSFCPFAYFFFSSKLFSSNLLEWTTSLHQLGCSWAWSWDLCELNAQTVVQGGNSYPAEPAGWFYTRLSAWALGTFACKPCRCAHQQRQHQDMQQLEKSLGSSPLPPGQTQCLSFPAGWLSTLKAAFYGFRTAHHFCKCLMCSGGGWELGGISHFTPDFEEAEMQNNFQVPKWEQNLFSPALPHPSKSYKSNGCATGNIPELFTCNKKIPRRKRGARISPWHHLSWVFQVFWNLSHMGAAPGSGNNSVVFAVLILGLYSFAKGLSWL